MKNMLIAFILNIAFSLFELLGGLFSGSVAIISDAVHDFGDAISIGISLVLEKISHRHPNKTYTYGYLRYSVLGAFITTSILLIGSSFVIYESFNRIWHPVPLNYDGMLLIAVFGVIINSLATYFTHNGSSLNQKAVNLHMLEDVLGWVVVLIGAIIIRFSHLTIIDPIMSIGVALFILWHAIHNFKEIIDIILEKVPTNISIDKLEQEIRDIKGIEDVHHIHIWSIDGVHNYGTMHVITKEKNPSQLKQELRARLKKKDIDHLTIEVENPDDNCEDLECHVSHEEHKHHH